MATPSPRILLWSTGLAHHPTVCTLPPLLKKFADANVLSIPAWRVYEHSPFHRAACRCQDSACTSSVLTAQEL
ncbi:hypothetical protein HYPSUDRAFT_41072 [Hypholoma sublateritium FD-334 SS-4]|uniref:Uncharacterized protein n=1 Tax=Hypholoma sublateritium (strain FD-334 SS-4) TaxID=945553 RepID=A0A0D2MFR4_HYPSF|nr:hypothetical protein HYPSUDRAFT_41072 [Hypholoma sublateritium FD-334 SS-4]